MLHFCWKLSVKRRRQIMADMPVINKYNTSVGPDKVTEGFTT